MIETLVAEVELDVPRRLTVIRQLVAARVAQHVDMDRERQVSIAAGLFDDPLRGADAQRRAALALEHEVRPRPALRRPQYPQFPAGQRLGAIETMLGAAHHEQAGVKIDLRPFERDQLADAETVPVANQDERPVALGVAVAAGGGDQGLDFALMEPVAAACA
jgi:hypothetical protein